MGWAEARGGASMDQLMVEGIQEVMEEEPLMLVSE